MFDDSFNSFDYAASYDYGSPCTYTPFEHEDPVAYVVPVCVQCGRRLCDE